jgi:alpha-L-fucosidase 2
MDQQVIWDTFTSYLEAAELLGKDDTLANDVRSALADLALPAIGRDGRLMEWREEFEEVEPGHRHVSHLYGLHPGNQYTAETTPEMVAAAEKSLDHRLSHGGGHTGWSRTWLINFRARLHDGEKAHEDVRAFIGKLTIDNLFCTHPPFQIDGNFGYTAGVAEMLLQSHTGEIELLPALPVAWQNGTVQGLCARGGFVIDMEWENGNLVRAVIHSRRGNPCRILYGSKRVDLAINKGARQEITFD